MEGLQQGDVKTCLAFQFGILDAFSYGRIRYGG